MLYNITLLREPCDERLPVMKELCRFVEFKKWKCHVVASYVVSVVLFGRDKKSSNGHVGLLILAFGAP